MIVCMMFIVIWFKGLFFLDWSRVKIVIGINFVYDKKLVWLCVFFYLVFLIIVCSSSY